MKKTQQEEVAKIEEFMTIEELKEEVEKSQKAVDRMTYENDFYRYKFGSSGNKDNQSLQIMAQITAQIKGIKEWIDYVKRRIENYGKLTLDTYLLKNESKTDNKPITEEGSN